MGKKIEEDKAYFEEIGLDALDEFMFRADQTESENLRRIAEVVTPVLHQLGLNKCKHHFVCDRPDLCSGDTRTVTEPISAVM